MDTLHIILYLIIALAVVGLIIGIIYAMKYHNKKTLTTNDPYPIPNNNSPPSIGIVVIFLLIFIGFIVLAGFGVYTSLKRYQLADYAIKHGDTGTAIAALSPEIGMGISSIAQGIDNSFYH